MSGSKSSMLSDAELAVTEGLASGCSFIWALFWGQPLFLLAGVKGWGEDCLLGGMVVMLFSFSQFGEIIVMEFCHNLERIGLCFWVGSMRVARDSALTARKKLKDVWAGRMRVVQDGRTLSYPGKSRRMYGQL